MSAMDDAEPAAAFCRIAEAELQMSSARAAISDEALRRVLTAAVKLYAARVEDTGIEARPFVAGAVTATEAVVATCAMIRAVDLNPFDLAMWFRRPIASDGAPEDA
jgi:hypothetical protein